MIVSGEMDGLWVLIADWNAGALDQIPSATQRQEDKTQTNTDIGDQLNRTHCLTLPDMWFAILHGSCALTTCPTSFTTTICPVAPVPYETDCFLPCVIICVCEFWCETSACVPTLYSLFCDDLSAKLRFPPEVEVIEYRDHFIPCPAIEGPTRSQKVSCSSFEARL